MADLILGRDSELIRMPRMIRGVPRERALRKWEPEPFPWLASRAIQSAYTWEESLCRSDAAAPWRKLLAGKLNDGLSRLMS